MSKKKYDAATLIINKLKGESYFTYEEIASITGYHPKYIYKLRRDILNREIKITHGNKDRHPSNLISPEEEKYICDLYRRSHATIRAFSRFYSKRSYTCIYNVLKRNNLIEVKEKGSLQK